MTRTSPCPQFFSVVALPLFQSFSDAFPACVPLTLSAKANYEMWLEEKERAGN